MTMKNEAEAVGESHVFVGIFQGLIQKVEVFRDAEQAEEAFARFCGVPYADVAEERAELHFNYEDSTIYVAPLQ